MRVLFQLLLDLELEKSPLAAAVIRGNAGWDDTARVSGATSALEV